MMRALLILLVLCGSADAHSFYSITCCAAKDCGPVPDDAVTATASGWFIVATGETISYGDNREQRSQDMRFHRCVYQLGQKAGSTRCLYVPGAGT